jgi:hypothetical protein
MKLWTCTSCGAVERLSFHPDACSSCGGQLEAEDGRIASFAEPEIPSELFAAAAEGDEAATVELWTRGAPRGCYSGELLDALMLRNRREQLLSLFGQAA